MNEERIAYLKDKLKSWPGEMALTSADMADLLSLLDEAEKTRAGAMAYHLRPEVGAFAAIMEAELRKHDDRPGWKNEDVQWLFSRLKDESAELIKAIHTKGPISVGREAADVANFAMMIADVTGGLTQAQETRAGEGSKVSALKPLAEASSPGSEADERALDTLYDVVHDPHCFKRGAREALAHLRSLIADYQAAHAYQERSGG